MTIGEAPEEQPPQRCKYSDRNGRSCNRAARPLTPHPYCIFHLGHIEPDSFADEYGREFAAQFTELVGKQDGAWHGFAFPPGVKFPKEVGFPVDASHARFDALELDDVVFKNKADFSEATFIGGIVMREVTFEGSVTFDRCHIDGALDFLHVQCQDASFYRAEFSGRSIIRANFKGTCNFNEAVFKDDVTFAGWRNVSAELNARLGAVTLIAAALSTDTPTFGQRIAQWRAKCAAWLLSRARELQKGAKEEYESARQLITRVRRRFQRFDSRTVIFRMFERESHMSGVVFIKPAQTVFNEVDLFLVHFRGTNLRGARFLGVNWWQPALRRNGLRDEVFVLTTPDGPFRHHALPALEETCRNARVALEENRDFNTASDFYIGEMDAHRLHLPLTKRHILSVHALYRFVSNYGTSVATALRILSYLLALHFALSVFIASNGDDVKWVESVGGLALRSLKAIALQTPEALQGTTSIWQAWVDTFFRVLAPIQIAMLALAFRSRIKRH